MTEVIDANTNVNSARQRSAAAIALAQLEACGARTVFGIPGVHTLALYDALHESSLTHILARHEQGAGFMADGYARATGEPAVALVITGPGVTNVATPIGEAYTDSSPVFVLSSNVESDHVDAMRGNLHDLKDQRAVMRAVTKWNERAASASDVAPLIAEGWRQMTTGRTLPVHVEIPIDVLDDPVDDAAIEAVAGETAPAEIATEIEAAAEALAGASRPVVYVGGGATSSDAGEAITRIAEILKAPIVSSFQGKGAVPASHPQHLGSLWTQGNAVDELVRKADALLVVGSRLGVQATERFAFPIPDTLVRIDIDAEEMTRNATPTVAIQADARYAAEQLVVALESRETTSTWSPAQLPEVRAAAAATAFGADRVEWLDAIRAAMPDDGCIAWDMTMMSYVATYHYPVERPRTFLFPTGFGTLGFAMPAAIGAKVGLGDTPVAAVVGDGGFQFTMQELATAIQFRLGIPIIIFNDSTYSAVKDEQKQTRGGRYAAVDLVNPDYVKLAEAYGIPGVRAESPEELTAAIREALTRDQPTIIDVPIEGWV
jgi:acetolactate synthase-1/2/3 large subunit